MKEISPPPYKIISIQKRSEYTSLKNFFRGTPVRGMLRKPDTEGDAKLRNLAGVTAGRGTGPEGTRLQVTRETALVPVSFKE